MYYQPSIPPATYHHYPNHSIHGNLLEVTVVCCNKLKDTEWISRQDPYVCVEYGSNKSRTSVCTDGGKDPTFQEKFVYTLIEGLRELNISVWNSHTLTHDDFIGSGKVQLAKVLSEGFDDSSWPLQTKTGRHAGEVRLIMHYSNVNNNVNTYAPSAPPYVASGAPHADMYSALPPPPPPPVGLYPPVEAYYVPSPYSSYPPNSGVYPPSPYPPQPTTYPPQPAAYPPQPTTYPPQPSAYPHQRTDYPPLPTTYPPLPTTYPPKSAAYPHQQYGSHYPPGSAYPGVGYPTPY